MQLNIDSTELLNQLGNLPDEYTTNITNAVNIVNTTNIDNNDDNDNIEERHILDLLIKEAEEDKFTNKFRPAYLFIFLPGISYNIL